MLKYPQRNLTRVYDPDGSKIRVQAVAVWDTVGSLGIPNISILAKLGLPHYTKEYKFYDTDLSETIRHGFQALALDEHRAPFSPAVWERNNADKATTDLRQVWFPGVSNHWAGPFKMSFVYCISIIYCTLPKTEDISYFTPDTFLKRQLLTPASSRCTRMLVAATMTRKLQILP